MSPHFSPEMSKKLHRSVPIITLWYVTTQTAVCTNTHRSIKTKETPYGHGRPSDRPCWLHADNALDVLQVGESANEVVDFARIVDKKLNVAGEDTIARFDNQFVHIDAMLL